MFLVAWRRLEDIPSAAALPWLYGVAYRVVANHRCSARRRRRRLEQHAISRHDPGHPVDGSDVVAALPQLRRSDQEILRLAAWEGLSAVGISHVLGCTANAAALRLSRARKRLRAALTEIGRARTEDEGNENDVGR